MRLALVIGLAVLFLGAVVLLPAAFADPIAGSPLPDGAPTSTPEPTLAASRAPDRVEVWVDLEMLPLSSVPSLTAAQRAEYRREIDAQQTLLIERLRRWGAAERARVQLVRNAVVVEVPESAIEEIRQLPGVTNVQRVTHRNRPHTPTTTDVR